MASYMETVLRYRIFRHDDLPEGHKAAYRADGIDPDNLWSLIWSFNDKIEAEKCLADCIEEKASHETYKLVDAGSENEIKREIW